MSSEQNIKPRDDDDDDNDNNSCALPKSVNNVSSFWLQKSHNEVSVKCLDVHGILTKCKISFQMYMHI